MDLRTGREIMHDVLDFNCLTVLTLKMTQVLYNHKGHLCTS